MIVSVSLSSVRGGKCKALPPDPPVPTQEMVVQGDGSWQEGPPVAFLVTAVPDHSLNESDPLFDQGVVKRMSSVFHDAQQFV